MRKRELDKNAGFYFRKRQQRYFLSSQWVAYLSNLTMHTMSFSLTYSSTQ